MRITKTDVDCSTSTGSTKKRRFLYILYGGFNLFLNRYLRLVRIFEKKLQIKKAHQQFTLLMGSENI